MPQYGYSSEPKPPSAEHPFGLTSDQHDIYYGVIWGTRTAFKVGISITGLALLIGLAVGSLSAYYGGLVDEGVMRVVEIFQAFPFVLAAITLATILRANNLLSGVLPTVIGARSRIESGIIGKDVRQWKRPHYATDYEERQAARSVCPFGRPSLQVAKKRRPTSSGSSMPVWRARCTSSQ